MDSSVGKFLIDTPGVLIPPVMMRLLAAPVPEDKVIPAWVAYRDQINLYLSNPIYKDSSYTTLFLFIGLIAQGMIILALSRIIESRVSRKLAFKILKKPRSFVKHRVTEAGNVEMNRLESTQPDEAEMKMDMLVTELATVSRANGVPFMYSLRQVLFGLAVAFPAVGSLCVFAFARGASQAGLGPKAFLAFGLIWILLGAVCYLSCVRMTRIMFVRALNFVAVHGRVSNLA